MPPALLVVVRHGEREDRVNADWKKTARRAHDPPLTQKGGAMAAALGHHYFERLLEHAFSMQDSHAAWPSLSSDIADGTVHQMLANTVILTSPLTRCVQTSHNIAMGLHRAACDHTGAADQTAVPKCKIVIEDTLVEEDKWMGIDLRGATVPAPSPLLYDATHHAAHTSDLVCHQSSSRPSLLCATNFVFDDENRLVEVPSSSTATSKSGKKGAAAPLNKISVQERSFAAISALTSGALDALLDGKFVFLVSHGKTSMTWYNVLAGRLARAANGQLKETRDAFDGSVPYTGYAELRWVPGSGYVSSSAPFVTPHLKDAEQREQDASA